MLLLRWYLLLLLGMLMEKWLCLCRSWSGISLERWRIVFCWGFEVLKLWLLYRLWLQLLFWCVLERLNTLKHVLFHLIILRLGGFAYSIIPSRKHNDCLCILIHHVFNFFHILIDLSPLCHHHSQLELSKHLFKVLSNVSWLFYSTEVPCILI